MITEVRVFYIDCWKENMCLLDEARSAALSQFKLTGKKIGNPYPDDNKFGAAHFAFEQQIERLKMRYNQ